MLSDYKGKITKICGIELCKTALVEYLKIKLSNKFNKILSVRIDV